ncbi:hypothetical protein [Frankia sp. Cas3]|uniref:hypothetical protein n=1 Tax=Frankia sp. Cas3 TaxID=3073926 RepID=UPI002AD2BBC0|nr:hypothetical protein [Frankia sp. Cas3]
MARRTTLTPEQRTLRARLAAYASHVNHDPAERTQAARNASPSQLSHWERKVRAEHPDLPDAEVTRRGTLLHRQYMVQLAFRSSRAASRRRAGKAGKGTAAPRDAS